MNTNVITALGMCKVCTEAIHSVARKRQDWTCESTCEHENARNQPVDAKTAKTRKQENRKNGENAKTAKTRKRENGENDENPKTAKSVPVFWFSISRFLVFSVFWFSRFLVFSFRWPHPSGQVAFFMCLATSNLNENNYIYFSFSHIRFVSVQNFQVTFLEGTCFKAS